MQDSSNDAFLSRSLRGRHVVPRVGSKVPPTIVLSTGWADAQVQSSFEGGRVLSIPAASHTVRVALDASTRPTITDSGSDSDAPLVTIGRFTALSDDITLVEPCSGRVDNCS